MTQEEVKAIYNQIQTVKAKVTALSNEAQRIAGEVRGDCENRILPALNTLMVEIGKFSAGLQIQDMADQAKDLAAKLEAAAKTKP